MNKEIAHVLKERLTGLQFIEVLAGLAQKVTHKQEDENGNPLTKIMPVSYDTNTPAACKVTPETALVPNSTKKGILYFEDLGCVFIDRAPGGMLKYRSSLILVCWMNKKRLVTDAYAEITAQCIAAILGKLNVNRPTNEGNFSRLTVTPGKIMPQDASVFSRYTYSEEVTQYLRPPFEFFGIELLVTFCINPDCINQIEFIPINEPVCY